MYSRVLWNCRVSFHYLTKREPTAALKGTVFQQLYTSTAYAESSSHCQWCVFE